MLLSLSIRNVVLIDQLDLSLRPGLCVLTGETGAGKSILLDALGLALGFRGDSGLVRPGAAQASVSAEFEIPDGHPARGLLDGQGLDAGGNLVLRRVLGTDGRSRAFVNDQPVSIGLLRQIGDCLVEIEGQFAEQGLLNPATHRDTLDAFGGLLVQVERTRDAWRRWRAALAERDRAAEEMARARARQEELSHELNELESLDPKAGEESALAEERSLLMHREKLIEALNAAMAELGAETGSGRDVEGAVRAAARHLDRIAETASARILPAIQALDRAAVEIAEAGTELGALGNELDMDPAHLERIEERLFALRGLARKHGVAVDALPALRGEIADKLAGIADGDSAFARLAEAEGAAHAAFVEAAAALSRERDQAAAALDSAVAEELPALKLDKAVFRARIDALEEEAWGEHGTERVSFEVSTNPGAPMGPLNRIASGGELARFMLALKVVTARAGAAATLVFDEVDHGVGGSVAAAIGERLAILGRDRQVLVVTHSPQVAARGGYHWRVTKAKAGGGKEGVVTRVAELTPEERREEIARMLSGRKVTEEARAAAERLLQSA